MNKTFRLLAAAIIPALSWLSAQAADVQVTTPTGRTVTLTVINDNVIRVSNIAPGETLHKSRSVVLEPGTNYPVTSTSGDVTTLITGTGVVATVNASTGAVSIVAGGDRAVSDDGVRLLADSKREMSLYTMGSGSFYGAGERGYSYNLAGDTLVMYNKQNYGYTAGEKRIKQMNITMPLFISSAGYAVLFDDYAAAEMVMSNPIKYVTESPDPISYYFINGGGTLAGVTREYTALTGRQSVAPLWSLGYITSKYGYKTEDETRGVIDTLKREGYPVDGIVLDLYWYGKEQDMGRLAWDPEQWPTHKKMLSDLKDNGVNMVIISQPYVLRNGRAIDNYNLLAPRGMFVADSTGKAPQEVKIWVGEGGMFDVSNPETRTWLRNRYKDLTLEGVGGWWGDLGEPEVHPETGLHANGLTARQYHNQYGNDWSEIIYDLFKEEFPDTRLMTMMRGGTAGLQRYSVYPWSTDVSRSWGGLKPQVTIMLNSGLSGLGYMSHDVGGFAIDPENPTDPELYVRWLQLGTFSPILRTHSQQVAEPYHYKEYKDIILPLIKERYRWLPYNYSLAMENALTGAPLVRPLDFKERAAKPMDLEDEYMWGDEVLVAPVLDKGVTERSIVLPAGKWIDYNNPTKVYDGNSTITYAAPLSVLPMLVRAGSFIPMAEYKMANTRDYDPAKLTVNFYPLEGIESIYVMYEDDRKSTRSIADAHYTTLTFTGRDADGVISISVDTGDSIGYEGMPATRSFDFRIFNVDAPKSVTVDGKLVKGKAWKYDAATRTLTVSAKWNTAISSLRVHVAY